MLEIINPKIDEFRASLETLKNSERPIAIFGAGEVASRVSSILRQHGIDINAVFTDSGDPCATFDGLPIQRLTGSSDLSRFHWVGGIGDYKTLTARFSKSFGINDIILFDNIYNLPELSFSFIGEHLAEFTAFCNSLSDVESQKTLNAYLNARASGNPRHMFSCDLTHQYFPTDIPGYLPFDETGVFIDCGAFTGDTIIDFVRFSSGCHGPIYAFEPDKNNFIQLSEMVTQQNIAPIHLINAGVGAAESSTRFFSDKISSRVCDNGTETVQLRKLDNDVRPDNLALIKMDIEGGELDALKGAERLIREFNPRLAISIYHKPTDLIDIPQYLQSIVPHYSFYLRAHRPLSIDVVLYAVP